MSKKAEVPARWLSTVIYHPLYHVVGPALTRWLSALERDIGEVTHVEVPKLGYGASSVLARVLPREGVNDAED